MADTLSLSPSSVAKASPSLHLKVVIVYLAVTQICNLGIGAIIPF